MRLISGVMLRPYSTLYNSLSSMMIPCPSETTHSRIQSSRMPIGLSYISNRMLAILENHFWSVTRFLFVAVRLIGFEILVTRSTLVEDSVD